jgi:hypothetical protein
MRAPNFHEKFAQRANLIEWFPTRDRDAVSPLEPMSNQIENVFDSRDAAIGCPGIQRNASRTVDRAALKPNGDACSWPK